MCIDVFEILHQVYWSKGDEQLTDVTRGLGG